MPLPHKSLEILVHGAGGGNRTHTLLPEPRILSPVRLPVSPPRLVVESVVYADSEPRAAAIVPAMKLDRAALMEVPVAPLSR